MPKSNNNFYDNLNQGSKFFDALDDAKKEFAEHNKRFKEALDSIVKTYSQQEKDYVEIAKAAEENYKQSSSFKQWFLGASDQEKYQRQFYYEKQRQNIASSNLSDTSKNAALGFLQEDFLQLAEQTSLGKDVILQVDELAGGTQRLKKGGESLAAVVEHRQGIVAREEGFAVVEEEGHELTHLNGVAPLEKFRLLDELLLVFAHVLEPLHVAQPLAGKHLDFAVIHAKEQIKQEACKGHCHEDNNPSQGAHGVAILKYHIENHGCHGQQIEGNPDVYEDLQPSHVLICVFNTIFVL